MQYIEHPVFSKSSHISFFDFHCSIEIITVNFQSSVSRLSWVDGNGLMRVFGELLKITLSLQTETDHKNKKFGKMTTYIPLYIVTTYDGTVLVRHSKWLMMICRAQFRYRLINYEVYELRIKVYHSGLIMEDIDFTIGISKIF